MYHKEDDRYSSNRRENPDQRDKTKDHRSSRRNRWDDRGSDSGQSRSGQFNERGRGESRTDTYWEEKRRDRKDDRESTYRERRRSRSRSRSPFRKNMLNCTNPTKEESVFTHQISDHSITSSHVEQSRKKASWSESSDEDESFEEKSNPTLEYGKARNSSVDDMGRYEGSSTLQTKSAISEGVASSSSSGISLKLGGLAAKPMPLPKVISVPISVKSTKVAAIFNADDDDEPEEMPPECKMRMKNVGRETKTSEGPNSFGKTKIGFCNMSHLAEKQLEGKPVTNKKP